MKFSYFPGCTLKTKAKDLDAYARKSAQALGFELQELPDWQCCGGVYPLGSDEIADVHEALTHYSTAFHCATGQRAKD